MKSLYDSTARDWKKILKLIDNNNDIDFETFNYAVTSYFDSVDYYLLNDLCEFITDELGAYCDSELIDLTEEDIDSIIEYLKNK